MWLYRNCFPFSGVHCLRDPFSFNWKQALQHVFEKDEYKVDDHSKKAALFFLACEANPDTRLLILAALRANGYTDVKAADQILVQQVRRKSQKNKPKDSPCPESVAASPLLALVAVVTMARPAL